MIRSNSIAGLSPEIIEDAAKRLWAKVDKSGKCWVWPSPGDRGYGQIRINGFSMSVHRLSYEIANGPIPAGLVLDHLCRNRSCVNPDHLRVTTNRENILSGIGLTSINARKKVCISLAGYRKRAALKAAQAQPVTKQWLAFRNRRSGLCHWIQECPWWPRNQDFKKIPFSNLKLRLVNQASKLCSECRKLQAVLDARTPAGKEGA